ncbi:MAG TPA: tetratricopeptide repeat protein [Casimicrobiaceae bacterium]|nr:tetratricopeptide repeat protein [Casimicrobiaceae bacterium]
MKRILATLIALVPALALAIVVTNQPGSGSIDPQGMLRGLKSAELEEVINLLKRKQREEAKHKLAEYMKRNPRDGRAPEIAGYIFLEEKNFSMADYSFNRALELNPSQATARAKLGLSKLIQGKPAEAEAQFVKALEQQPNEFIARRHLAAIEEGRGNPAGAIPHYEALMRSPAMPSGVLTDEHVRLARAYYLVNAPQAAIALIEPLTAKPDSTALATGRNLVLGRAFAALGDRNNLRKSIAALQKTLPKNNSELRILEAGLARLEGRNAVARDMLAQIAKESPGLKATMHYEIARTWQADNNWREAIKELKTAAGAADPLDLPVVLRDLLNIAIDNHVPSEVTPVLVEHAKKHPSSAALALLVAQGYIESHDEANAMTWLTKLRNDHSRFAPGHHMSGLFAFAQQRHADAEASFKRAVAIHPRYVEAWVALSGQQLALREPAKAEATVASGLEANPGSVPLLFQKAAIADVMGRHDDANAIYRSILAKFPTHVPSLNKLASNLADANANLPEAARYAEQAYKLAPNDATIRGTYGWVMVRGGNVSAGLPLLESSMKELSKDGTANFHLGTAYMKSGKAEEGRRLLARAVELGVSPAVKTEIDSLLK